MKKSEKVDIINGLEEITPESYSQFALFYKPKTSIRIPNKTYTVLDRYIPAEMLADIHSDKETAIELCLFFLTNLSETYVVSISESTTDQFKKDGWKRLRSDYLNEQLGYQYKTKTAIMRVLEFKGKSGKIMECDHKYCAGLYSFGYRLGKNYFGKGIKEHILKTETVKRLVNAQHTKELIRSAQNPICNNLMMIYSDITIPTAKQIKEEAKRLMSDENWRTNKGLKLKFLNKHKKEYYKNADQITWVEDCIEIFEYLTKGNCDFLMPKAGDKRSGGRVYDSFTLMPSWIRDMVRINDQKITKIDFSALHPNICANLYKGTTEYITHQKISEESGIDKKDVKTEHLSFFNKTWEQMGSSPLFKYYTEKEPDMMQNIFWDKYDNDLEQGEMHKITSMKMFEKEVQIMTECVKRLNFSGIYVGYIYDALFCSPNYAGVVKQVMDEVALEFGVKTAAKIS